MKTLQEQLQDISERGTPIGSQTLRDRVAVELAGKRRPLFRLGERPGWMLAIGFAIITFLGQLTYAATVIGTAATGKAITQEVLVEKVTADGEAEDE